MSGDDREPIGRKGKPSPPKPKGGRPARRNRDDDEESRSVYQGDDEQNNDDVSSKAAPQESRMTRKTAAAGKAGKAANSKKPRKRRRWLGLLIKLFIIFVVLMAAYGVYLDSEIRSRIDGKVWQLPAAVYGRMVTLEPGSPYTEKEMINLLVGTQYRQVTSITRPGEFVVRGATSTCCADRLTSRTAKKGRSMPD